MAVDARRSRRRAGTIAATAVFVMAVGASCAPDAPDAAVGLSVEACDPGIEVGSGMLIAPGLVLTAAHVVSGADAVTVHHRGRDLPGTVVGFDPNMDLAYLAVDALPTRFPDVDSADVARGAEGTAWVVRDGEVEAVPVTIRRSVRIRTEDIYIEGETLRPGFELDADIRAGDSGGAVVVDGRVVGVIWARSNKFDERAYAIDAVRAAELIDEQRRSGDLGDDIDITRC